MKRCERSVRLQRLQPKHVIKLSSPLMETNPSKPLLAAVVGAGPGGLIAAAALRNRGIAATIFERRYRTKITYDR